MISSEQYENFLKSVVQHLEGDWLVIGGSLLAILKTPSRATVDIDLCPLAEMNNDLRLSLMKVAQEAGLSIESINPAADFFLQQIPNWKSSIIPFLTGAKGALYRPSFELYLQLKLNRCSQTDIEDCRLYLDWCLKNKSPVDKEASLLSLQKKIEELSSSPSKTSSELINQLQNLKNKFNN